MSNTDSSKAIGRVVATEKNPTTTSEVRFWLSPDVELRPYDFVRLMPGKDAPDLGTYYAKVTHIEEVSDEGSSLSGFTSADFGRADIHPRVKRIVTTTATASIVYNDENREMPVPHYYEVHWPEEAGVKKALGLDDFKRNIPAGYITMSGPNRKEMSIPISMNADYVIGPEGAHLNISGISGLATKTSFVTFLLTSIQQIQGRDWPNKKQATFLILNVKGNDLLRIDEPAEGEEGENGQWERCGLTHAPMKDVVYFFPYSDREEEGYAQTYLDSQELEGKTNAFRYYFSWEEAQDNLSLLMEDIDDPQQTMVSCAVECQQEFSDSMPWSSVRDKIREKTQAGTSRNKSITVQSWRKFSRLMISRTKHPVFSEGAVVKKEEKRQVPFEDILNHMGPGKVVVVDIARLPDYLQSFVVGTLTNLVRLAKGGALQGDDKTREIKETVILFADELNKFAPNKRGERTIASHLREISERGRTEGIVLFGAEQFRSQVDDRVTGNCSTHIFGRTQGSEVNRDPEIKSLPEKGSRVTRLSKGQLIASHTPFSTAGIRLRFPKPGYRQS